MSTPATSALRKYWKPILATSAGGTSLILWFEEVVVFVTELFELFILLTLFLLAGPIYLYNYFVFRSTRPRKEDIKR